MTLKITGKGLGTPEDNWFFQVCWEPTRTLAETRRINESQPVAAS